MNAPLTPLSFKWEDVVRALLASKGIKSGLWRLSVTINFAGTTIPWQKQPGPEGQADEQYLPTGLMGIAGVMLLPADAKGPMVFDASESKALSVVPRSGKEAKQASSSRPFRAKAGAKQGRAPAKLPTAKK